MNACAVSWAVVRLALGSLESGNNDLARGRAGEISRYQIQRQVWKHETWRPLADAQKPNVAWEVAKTILQARSWRITEATRKPPTPQQIYALWNAPGKMCRVGYRVDRLPKRIRERCERFASLCEKYAKEGK